MTAALCPLSSNEWIVNSCTQVKTPDQPEGPAPKALPLQGTNPIPPLAAPSHRRAVLSEGSTYLPYSCVTRFALPGKDKWKASSISQQQADKQKKEARQERSLHNADLMGRFMRLCDVIMVDGLLDLAREALHEIVSELHPPTLPEAHECT